MHYVEGDLPGDDRDVLFPDELQCIEVRKQPESKEEYRDRTGDIVEAIEGLGPDELLEYLAKITSLVDEAQFAAALRTVPIPAVHLRPTRTIRRQDTSGRAYPLNETDQPTRDPDGTASERVEALRNIIAWLAVESSPRYLPGGGLTFCNIYAYDYCYLATAYLPRIWWTDDAIRRIRAGENVPPVYNQTLREMGANSLFNWLKEHGPSFGWERTTSLDELQAAANSGLVGIISAQRKELSKSGHICAVAPETDPYFARRSGGAVTVPVQSQAGVENFQYGGKLWWTSTRFRDFGFWIHQ